MANHRELHIAVGQMADGSKSGFHTFYFGTSQYVYSSALLLYGEHEDACRFMIDFYQYLYLHLPEYDRSQDLEKWISRLVMERFRQLAIGKNIQKPSAEQQMTVGLKRLSKNEQTRIWHLLEANMHFPPERARHTGVRMILLSALLILLLLASCRYAPVLLEKLQTAVLKYTADTSSDDDLQETDDTADIDTIPAEELQTSDDESDDTGTGDADIPKMDTPEMDVPEMDIPEMDIPEMDVPEMDVPEMDVPEMDIPVFS